tara:strand:- start:108 stop:392 length:285 start_codon:yes stop_codon:yes gene_type:complete
MNEFKPIPEALSHKDLRKLLVKAEKDIQSDNSDKDLEELIERWSTISQELLENFGPKKNQLTQGKGPSSIMALGAMEVHLNMAVQAFKVSEKED